MLPATDPKKLFDEHVEQEFLEITVRTLFDAYRSSYERCHRDYDLREANDLWPYERRAAFDRDWKELAQDFSGIEVSSQPNNSGNCYHAEIKCGPVLITASHVDDHRSVVRPAGFRNTLSIGRQLWLFDTELPPDDAPLYALLIHGGELSNRWCPSFADIVFPSAYCLSYVDRIRLFDRCADVVRSMTTFGEELVPDNLAAELRTNDKARKSEGA